MTTQRIRELNDLLRTTGLGGQVFLTAGICALPEAEQAAIQEKVQTFDDFTEDNDPHGEHDFGAFELGGEKVFWKIDYYNRTMDAGSEDPADPARTRRVLTILLAEEY